MFGNVLFVYLFDINQVLTAKCELCWSVGDEQEQEGMLTGLICWEKNQRTGKDEREVEIRKQGSCQLLQARSTRYFNGCFNTSCELPCICFLQKKLKREKRKR